MPHDSLVRGRPRDHQGTISPGRPLVRRRYRHGLGARPHYGRSRRGRHRRQPCRQHRPGHAAPSIRPRPREGGRAIEVRPRGPPTRPRPREGGRARRRAPTPAQCQGQSPKVQTTSTRNAPRPPFHARSSALWGTTPHARSTVPRPRYHPTPAVPSHARGTTPRPRYHPTPAVPPHARSTTPPRGRRKHPDNTCSITPCEGFLARHGRTITPCATPIDHPIVHPCTIMGA